ncbi:MAG: formylglycine-generating enzyme family protein [Chloroflexi bacterium]|nr:formylglycine-generating enzyme family protein [Chloroflexota bacterium]
MPITDDLSPAEKRQPIHSRERVRFEHRVAHGIMEDKLILALAPDLAMEFVRVPAGEFLMGSHPDDLLAYDDETPQHKIYLLDYFIGKYPVTIAQFDVFARATKLATRTPLDTVDPHADHPVTQVSWHDAYAFGAWLSKLKGLWIRLPSEAEWEKAARGADGRSWSWGNHAPTPDLANIESPGKTTTRVGAFSPRGDSPYGCADMIGNVWEWTRSLFKPYPYQNDDWREQTGDLGMRVVRGGSFFSKPNRARCASRLRQPPNNRFEKDIGFRVCALIAPPDFNNL